MAVLAVIVVLVAAAVALLHSAGFHRYILGMAQQKATAALGTQVEARDFALRLSATAPTLDLYDVTVAGAQPYTKPPLLQVDHVGLRVRIASFLHGRWYLDDVRLDHPVARVFVDQRGGDNLPKPTSSGQNHTSVFDLGVRHAVVVQGEVYYNDRKSVLNADLHDMEFASSFDTSQRQYFGTLSYRDGHLQFGTYRPMPHNFEARFAATPAVLTLQHAVLSSGPSRLLLEATLRNYSHPEVSATYDATLDGGQFRRILQNPSLPEGVVRMAGSLRYQNEPNRPMLDTVAVNGTLSSRRLQVSTPGLRAVINDIGARYTLANGNLELPEMRARLLGGQLTGTLTIHDLSGAAQSRLRTTARGISLADLEPLVNSPSLRQVALGGIVNADANAAWKKSFTNLTARIDATLQASVAPAQPGVAVTGAKNAFPVSGAIHARYAAATKQIALSQSYLRMPQTSVTLDGAVSNASALQVRVQSNDLHELETIAQAFRSAAPAQPAQPLGIYGTGSFLGEVRGSTSAPRVSGQLTAANLRVKGSAWRVLRTNITLSPSQANLRDGYLQPADHGRIAFDIVVGLRHWSFTDTSPIEVSLNGSQLNLASLAKAAGVQMPATGTLSADVAVHGSELNPIGRGTVRLARGGFALEPFNLATLDFRGTGDQVHANLALHLPAGDVQATGEYFPKRRAYEAQLRSNGLRLDRLKTLQARNLQLAGVLYMDASGRGTLQNPGLQASLQVPQLQVKGQTISGLSLQAEIVNRVANVTLNSRLVNTQLRGHGTVNLTGNYDANAVLDTQTIPLQPLVAMYAPAQAANISGQTELHATLHGPLEDQSRFEAHAVLPTLSVNYKNALQIGAASPIHMDYSNGVLALQRAVIRGTGTELQLQATVPTNGSAPASMLAMGTIDLRLAQLVDPDISSSGQLRFNINSYGARSDPNVQGQIQIVNATLATGNVPVGLQDGNGVLTLTKDRLEITRFQGSVGGGSVTAHGGVVYRPSPRFDLAVVAHGMRLLYPAGVRETVDANLALTGTTQASTLHGQVQIEQLQFTPDFDLVEFANQLSGTVTPAPSQGMTQNMQLNVAVQSAGGLNLVSRTLSLNGTANLNVQGTAADPVVLGRVNLSSGDLIFMGNRYVVQGGTVDFANRSQTLPVVNVAVTTTIQQYNINMRLQGPADHLRTFYASGSGASAGRHHPPARLWQHQRSRGGKPDSGQHGGRIGDRFPGQRPGD